jgi:hypothetical protein
MTILKTFEQYLLVLNNSKLDCLDDNIKLRAFSLIVRESVPFPHGTDVLSKCYVLHQVSDPNPFLILVHQVLERKDYLKVDFFFQNLIPYCMKLICIFIVQLILPMLIFAVSTTNISENSFVLMWWAVDKMFVNLLICRIFVLQLIHVAIT